jgi:hypothetical protein
MTTICWTILHHTAAPLAHSVARFGHAARHLVGPFARTVAQAARPPSTAVIRSQTWFELVCKTIPAAIGSGGLLIPTPANPPRIADPPPAIIEPWPHFPPNCSPLGLFRLAYRRDPTPNNRRSPNQPPNRPRPASYWPALPGSGCFQALCDD